MFRARGIDSDLQETLGLGREERLRTAEIPRQVSASIERQHKRGRPNSSVPAGSSSRNISAIRSFGDFDRFLIRELTWNLRTVTSRS